MTDPVSISAAAVGVISFGIQTCQGLTSYYAALRAHDEECANTANSIDSLSNVLQNLKGLLSHVETQINPDTRPLLQHIDSTIIACGGRLEKLERLLKDFRGKGDPATVRDKWRNLKRKGLYPLRRDRLKLLREDAGNLQSTLSLATQVLQLNLHLNLHPELASTRASIEVINKRVDAAQQDQLGLNSIISQNLISLPHQIEAIFQTYQAHLAIQLEKLGQWQQETRAYDYLTRKQEEPRLLAEDINEQHVESIREPEFLPLFKPAGYKIDSPSSASLASETHLCKCPSKIYASGLGFRRSHFLFGERCSPSQTWGVSLKFHLTGHCPSCPFFGEYLYSSKVAMAFSYCSPLIAGCVEASCSMTRGCGRYSISPSLACRPVVPKDAPAFSLVRLKPYDEDKDCLLSEMELQTTLDRRVEKLTNLFQDRRASPYDVDIYGKTILHHAVEEYGHLLDYQLEGNSPKRMTKPNLRSRVPSLPDVFARFLRKLVNLHIPINATDDSGQTCLDHSLDTLKITLWMRHVKPLLSWPFFATNISCALSDCGAELSIHSMTSLADILWITELANVVEVFASSHEYAEVIQCNNTGLAALKRSQALLEKATLQDPESIHAQNRFGHTSLHLSIFWPKGLELLLSRGANTEAIDFRNNTPSDYCIARSLPEALRILASANASLSSPFFGNKNPRRQFRQLNDAVAEEFHCTNESRTNAEAVFDIVVETLAQTLRQIQIIVEHSLSDAMCQRLNNTACSGLLGTLALSAAVETLPTAVQPRQGYVKKFSKYYKNPYSLKYLNLRQFETLWLEGFRDVNGYDKFGLTPLMWRFSSVLSFPAIQAQADVFAWFISKGADLHKCQQRTLRPVSIPDEVPGKICIAELSETPFGVATAHYLASSIIQLPFKKYHECKERKELKEIIGSMRAISGAGRDAVERVFQCSLQDQCMCSCSISGCRPWTIALKSNVFGYQGSQRPWRTCQLFPYLCISRLIELYNPVNEELISDIVRVLTFEKLGLKHTCCSRTRLVWDEPMISSSYAFVEFHDEEDKQEIWVEQEDQLQDLEILLDEFAIKYHELGLPLTDFLGTYWAKRMKEYLEQQPAVHNAQLRRIGVRIDVGSKDSEEEEREDEELLYHLFQDHLKKQRDDGGSFDVGGAQADLP